jgi:YjjG family noncanonical pyrimidine nucleotidase
MKYNLFLIDLDDTLLDFKESERRSFSLSLKSLGIDSGIDELFKHYQIENTKLWKLFEQAQTTKEHLKIERFRKIFAAKNIEVDPALASQRYLDTLPETVVLIDGAVELCQRLSALGEIGIATNGIHAVQIKRINNSELAPYVSFVSVSEECGFAKPDVRFFDYSVKKARQFSKEKTLMIGDRLEADILGANNFGIDSCWFNPNLATPTIDTKPTFEVRELLQILG